VQPAWSIIVFTTLSGAGYGLLFWLGVAAAAHQLPLDRFFAAASLGLALIAVTCGLLTSALHLGRPERAWRAFSQWRSSWLSREGVASVATYVPALIFGWSWILRDTMDGITIGAAVLTAAGAAATVICTAYIYRSLKPIAHWHTGWVPANFLTLAGMSGALWLLALATAFGRAGPGHSLLAILTILVAAPVKLGYWRHIDNHPGVATVESATGLGGFGSVRLFEAPNTSEAYLMKEMGFQIARKHAHQLRRIAIHLAFLLPLLLILLAMAQQGWLRIAAALLAAPIATLGVLVERWLFFAEAKHTVTLYYGAARA
jgi:sulfite dehydrogenase (quinone) subunit SoeC